MFFDRLDRDAVAVADPDGELYTRFDVRRGGLREMFGLRAWRAGVRATLKGHLINRKVGDPWTLPTVLAIHRDSIVAEFVGEHAGDHPDIDSIPSTLHEIGVAT